MASNTLSLHLSNYSISICNSFIANNQIHINYLAENMTSFPIFENQSDKTAIDSAHIIEEMIKKTKIKNKAVNIIIPDDLTFTQILELPLLPEKELLSAVKYQSEQLIPMSVDQTAIDISTINEDRTNKKSTVLVVAAPITLITYLTKIIEYSDLIPDVIENEISSFSRFITQSAIIKLNQPTIFLNFGFNSISLYFFRPELNIVTDFYNFNIGINLFARELKIQTNISNEKIFTLLKEAGIAENDNLKTKNIFGPIINEISKNVLNYVEIIQQKYNYHSEKIYLINQANEIKNLNEILTQKTGILYEPLVFSTTPSIPNPYSHIFSFASNIK
jgi:Tfp pilus assembly PilM family ATPase